MNNKISIQFIPVSQIERAAWGFFRYRERTELVAQTIQLDRRTEERRRIERGDLNRRQPALSDFEHLILGTLEDYLSPSLREKYAHHKPVVLEGSQCPTPVLGLREAA